MALAQVVPLFPNRRPDPFPVTPLFPALDLKEINLGQILTICLEFKEGVSDRTRMSFLMTRRATFNIAGAAKGIIVDYHLSREIKGAFRGLNMFFPKINEPCILFGSCMKDEKYFLGVGEFRLHKIIKGKLFYWATKFSNGREKPYIFPYPISSWLIH